MLADFESGLEYAEAECILDVRRRGAAREYLVRWKDSPNYPDAWEIEDHLPRQLITQFKNSRRASKADAAQPLQAESPSSKEMMAAV